MSEPNPLHDDQHLLRWFEATDSEHENVPDPVESRDPESRAIPEEAIARILARARGERPVGDPPRLLPPLDARPTPSPVAGPFPQPSAWAFIDRALARTTPFARLALAATVLMLMVAGANTLLRPILVRIQGRAGQPREVVVRPGERVEIVNDGDPVARPVPPDTAPPGPRPETATTGRRIVDDSDPGYSEVGTGWVSGTLPGGFRGTYRYNTRGALVARWQFTDVPPGRYVLYATWLPHPNRAVDIPYTITEAGVTVARLVVHQNEPPVDLVAEGASWKNLGTFDFRRGPVTIEMDAQKARVRSSEGPGNSCVADAVMLVPIPKPAG